MRTRLVAYCPSSPAISRMAQDQSAYRTKSAFTPQTRMPRHERRPAQSHGMACLSPLACRRGLGTGFFLLAPPQCGEGSASKPGNVRKRQLAAADVHAAQFRAPGQRRKYLTGVEQPLVVKGAFQALLLVEVGLREHRRHEVALLDTDPVLAGQHAPHLD